MEYRQLKDGTKEILILVPELAMDRIQEVYINPLKNVIPEESFLIGRLFLEEKKTSATLRKQFIQEEVVPVVEQHKIKLILVTDGEYFKTLAHVQKSDIYLGYNMASPFFEADVMYVPNFFRIFYQPEIQDKINFALEKVKEVYSQNYQEPGKDIIHFAKYAFDYTDTQIALNLAMEHPVLTADIETYSLKHNDAGIASIALAWNEHEGVSIRVDKEAELQDGPKRTLLKNFFENYQGKLIWHNIAFDAYILIYQLWMKDQYDMEGLLLGMSVMLRNWDDTKLIAYLATNSCSRVSCSLKDLAQEFAGNYAQEEIENVSAISPSVLLKYNLTDALSTWYVYNKYFPKMIEDDQEDIYKRIFKPATKDIIQMQLTGLPIDLDRVAEVKKMLEADKEAALNKIHSLDLVHQYEDFLNNAYANKMNNTWKTKRITPDQANQHFNPSSGQQIADLLFVFCGLEPVNHTKSGQPATDAESLQELMNKTDREDIKTLLEGLMELTGVDKILSAFIPAFEKAIPSPDGWHWLCGNFNLGGTVSGRLSSNNPNLQNLPSTGTKYAKLIKSCFKTPKNKLFIGLDFASLEDRISALTTKDMNKLKVYTDHYDGHCLRAFSYFGKDMPDIMKEFDEAKDEEERVKIINSIKTRYKNLRQASKAPTFALTYQGTWRTLMQKCKINEADAKNIERKYHQLYRESDLWVKDKLKQAGKDGYVTCAFGLRVRTPLLAQVVKGNRATPKEAEAEGRTAGNALGQSWCLLNSRAASEFLEIVRNSPYKYKIRPCAQIHDAQYYVIDDDIDLLLWINETLVKCVQWQDDPAIYHPQVKLGGNLSLFFPDWAHELELPNHITKQDFISLVQNQKE